MEVALVSQHWFFEFKSTARGGVPDTYNLLKDSVDYKIITGYYHSEQGIPNDAHLIHCGNLPLSVKHIKFYLSAKRILKKMSPDLVHSNDFSSPVHNPCLLEVHQFRYTPEEPWLLRSPFFRFRRNYAIKRADAILVHVPSVKDVILKEVKVPEEKIHLMPYAIDPEMLKLDAGMRKIWRERLGLNGKLVFYYPARIHPDKGQHLILEGLKHVKKEILANSCFIMCGWAQNENYYKKLVELASKLPVKLIIDTSIIKYLYAASDVVISSSISDTCGTTIIEAMVLGKPLILSDLNIFREISKGNALFFRKDDVVELANEIEEAYENSSLRKEMINRGIKIFNKYYAPEVFEKRLLELYEAIL